MADEMPKRGRGRPKGSKNKTPEEKAKANKPKKRGRPAKSSKIGRPKGSKSSYTLTEKALAQRKEASPMVDYSRPAKNEEEMVYNAKSIEHILMIQEIASHADRSDPMSLRSCFINYLKLCQQDGMKVGNLAAYAAMGVDGNTVSSWLRSDRQEYKQLALFVKQACSLFREGMVADQKLNPVIGIFWQRNYDGLRNDTEQQQSIEQQDNENEMSSREYVKKYGKLLEE